MVWIIVTTIVTIVTTIVTIVTTIVTIVTTIVTTMLDSQDVQFIADTFFCAIQGSLAEVKPLATQPQR
jgi:hypothetical protein